MMSSKYGFLCFLALALVLALMIKNYEVWTQPVGWIPEESATKRLPAKPENKPEVLSTLGTQQISTSVKSYGLIAEKNIFSPDRKDFPAPTAAGGARQPVRPQVVLYGVTIIGNFKAASIASPGRPLQKGERETFTVKVGERVGDYKLAKILSDRITLETEGDTFEVLLYDQSKSKKRSDVRTESKPATITSSQPSPPTPAPAPGSPTPMPTSPTLIPAKPQASPPTGTGQQGVIAPQPVIPATPVNPAAPQTGFPRRRPYYPPSVPPEKTEGN